MSQQGLAAIQAIAQSMIFITVCLVAFAMWRWIRSERRDRKLAPEHVSWLATVHRLVTDLEDDTLARINFEAYREAVNGLSHFDRQIPNWEDLGERAQEGWHAGARRVGLKIVGPPT